MKFGKINRLIGVIFLLLSVVACTRKTDSDTDVSSLTFKASDLAIILTDVTDIFKWKNTEIDQGSQSVRVFSGDDYGTNMDEIKVDIYSTIQENTIKDYCSDLANVEYFKVGGSPACGLKGIYVFGGEIYNLDYYTTARVFYKNLIIESISSHVDPIKPRNVAEQLEEVLKQINYL